MVENEAVRTNQITKRAGEAGGQKEMKWLRKLLGVDKAIQEAKEDLLLEIEDTRRYVKEHIHADVAHGELTSRREVLFPKLVPYVLKQIDTGKVRTWEQYADWYITDHAKAIEWAIVDGTVPSIAEQANWIIEATKFAHIKLPINPNGPQVGLTDDDDGTGPVILCPPMDLCVCQPQAPGCTGAAGIPNGWDYGNYDSGFLDTLINHRNSGLSDWLNKADGAEDALEDPDSVDPTTTDS